MSQQMPTYDEIKDLLDAKLQVDQAQHDIILQKIAEIKEDTKEIKHHAKETNGNVGRNLERIHRLEIDQNVDNKFRRRSVYVATALGLFLVVELITKIWL